MQREKFLATVGAHRAKSGLNPSLEIINGLAVDASCNFQVVINTDGAGTYVAHVANINPNDDTPPEVKKFYPDDYEITRDWVSLSMGVGDLLIPQLTNATAPLILSNPEAGYHSRILPAKH